MLKSPPQNNVKPRGKHFKLTIISGQIVGALYVLPWETLVGPRTALTWTPFFQSEQVQGLLFAVIAGTLYELVEVFRK
jgi:hypothetical protein